MRHIRLNPTNIALLWLEETIQKNPKLTDYWTKSLSLFALRFSLFTATWASCHLPQRQSFFFSWTQYSTSFKPQKWSLLLYIVLFSSLKVIFSKLSQLDITACIKNCVYNNFDFCCYFMSSSIEHLYKSFSFVNSSVQLSNLN